MNASIANPVGPATGGVAGFPVRVEADLDTGLSRWLWLVKWLLVIPHYLVLAFLWLAFVVLSIGAFVGILVTGHYPRVLFDFNVGVLRWSWRVGYYAYGALGTDRYPPFSLAEVPDYPAHLEVAYPEHLSRGLALVKWWLLAIPHYLVIAFFVGGSGVFLGFTLAEGTTLVAGSGLIGLLVVIAAVVLLFTGRYPQQIFDFVLGLNRWVLRVAAYAALMTDDYPPFRLDLGGHDPGSVAVSPGGAGTPPAAAAAGTAPPASYPAAPTSSWTAGKIVSVVAGSTMLLLGLGSLVGGTAVAVADQNLRDDAGYFMSPTQELATGGFAIASEPLDLGTGATQAAPQAFLGDVRVEVTPAGEAPVFVGVASAADAAAYLAGVEHATLTGLETVDGRTTARYANTDGAAPATLPEQADIWVASAAGTGTQALEWAPESGDWTVVLMNADGSRDVAATTAVGATLPLLDAVVVWLFVMGGLLLLAGLALVVWAVFAARRTG